MIIFVKLCHLHLCWLWNFTPTPSAIILHSTTRLIPMLQQLRKGMELYGLVNQMTANAEACRPLFVPGIIIKVSITCNTCFAFANHFYCFVFNWWLSQFFPNMHSFISQMLTSSWWTASHNTAKREHPEKEQRRELLTFFKISWRRLKYQVQYSTCMKLFLVLESHMEIM